MFSSSELKLVPASNDPVNFRICASLDADRFYERGLYTLEVQSVTGAKIVNEWEMHWHVVKSNGETFSGSSKTSMTFDFNSEGEFVLVRSRALAKDMERCQQCTRPSPKPKPTPKPHLPKPHQGGLKPPPAHTIPFVLHSKSGNSWTSSSGSGIGTKYSISDSSKTQLITSGSICEKSLKENCEIKLPDGDYYFRVGGAGDDNRGDVAWTFCKVHSSSQSELSFSVANGECLPGALQKAEGMSDTIETTTVTMKGELLIDNVFEDELSLTAVEILEAGIADSMSVSREDVAVVYVCKMSRDKRTFCSEEWGVSDSTRIVSSHATHSNFQKMDQKEGRLLSETFSYDVVFAISFIAEKYDVVGTQYHDVLQVGEMLSSTLSESFQSGSLEIAVRGEASKVQQAHSLSFVRIIEMVSPVETDLSYKFKRPSQKTLEGLTDNAGVSLSEVLVIDESLEQESLFFIPMAIVIVVVALAVVMTRHRRNGTSNSLGNAEDSSWRQTIFGSEELNLSSSVHSGIISSAPECTTGERVHFESSFGPSGMDCDSCTTELLGSPTSNNRRVNRFVPNEADMSLHNTPTTLDAWDVTETNVRHDIMRCAQDSGSV